MSSTSHSSKRVPPKTKNHLFRFWGQHFRFLKPELERETLPPFDRHASIKQAISRIEGRSIDARVNDRHKGVVDLLLAELRLMNAGIQDDFNASLSSIMRNIEKKCRSNAQKVNKKKTDGGLFATSVAEGDEEGGDEVENSSDKSPNQDHMQVGVVKVSMLSELSSFVDDDDNDDDDDDDDDDHRWSDQESDNHQGQKDMQEDSQVTADDSLSRDSLRKSLEMVPQLDAEALEDFQTALRNIQIFYTNYSNDTDAIHAPILEERVTQSPRSQYINSQRQAHHMNDVNMGIAAYPTGGLDANSIATSSVHQQQSVHLDSLSSLSVLEPSVEIGFSQQQKQPVDNMDGQIVSSIVDNLPSALSGIRSQLVAQQIQEVEIENAENYMEAQHPHIKDEDLDLTFWHVKTDKVGNLVDKPEAGDDNDTTGKEKRVNRRGRPVLTSSQPPGAVVSFANGDTELKRPIAAASGEELKGRSTVAPPNMTARSIRSPRAVHAMVVHQNDQTQQAEKPVAPEAPKTTRLGIKSRLMTNTDKLRGVAKSIVAMTATNSVRFKKYAKKVEEELQGLPIRQSFAAYTQAQAAREPLFMKDKKM